MKNHDNLSSFAGAEQNTSKLVQDKKTAFGVNRWKRWSDEDKQFLRDNASKGSAYCAHSLRRTIGGVERMIRSIFNRKRNLWKEEEIAFLKENIHKGYDYVAKELDRSVGGIIARVQKHNIETGIINLSNVDELRVIQLRVINRECMECGKKLLDEQSGWCSYEHADFIA